MVKVFVHGVPETSAVWGALVADLRDRGLDDDVVLLSPPGFGAPVPGGWSATPAAYRAWLIDELINLVGDGAADPSTNGVDIVGHDWGAGHVYGLLAERPDLIRTWACDCAGILHPEYVWHDTAQQWQTPEVGEAVIELMNGISVEDRSAAYVDLGLTPQVADALAAAADETMGACILSLYRGAVPPALVDMADELDRSFSASGRKPRGLFIDAKADSYVGSEFAPHVAERFGVDRLELDGEGHWWMASPPAVASVAAALLDLWA